MGAANYGSVLAASGNGLRLVNCSNITFDNVWFRSQGVGLSVQGSSVTLNNIKTDGSTAYGVLATSSGGQNSTVNATSSHFDGTQSGDGLHLGQGTTATITDCTFDNNGGPSSQTGNGLVVEGGTTTTITNSHFDDNVGNGLFTWGNAQVTVSQSTFDGTTMGDGMHLTQDSSATISSCTFNNNGTAANPPASSDGFDIDGASTATVTSSQFNDNHNGGIVASDTSQLKLQSSTVVGNVHSDGAIFFSQANVTLTGNTFASNGQVVGITTGLNGVEFFGGAGQANNYTGTAVVSDNSFLNNTANGIYAASGGNLTISNNQFSGNVVGVFLDGTVASINATVVGNTIVTPANSPGTYNGITLQGTGLTATIGGAGTDGNTLTNFFDSAFIVEAFGTGPDTGLPHATILANAYYQNGNAISPSQANYVE